MDNFTKRVALFSVALGSGILGQQLFGFLGACGFSFICIGFLYCLIGIADAIEGHSSSAERNKKEGKLK